MEHNKIGSRSARGARRYEKGEELGVDKEESDMEEEKREFWVQ